MARTKPRGQAAAIPWRRSSEGLIEVLLVSTRDGRWTVPKGGIKRGSTAALTAEAEALEEAGVLGKVNGPSLGQVRFVKRGRAHEVLGFELRVTRLLPRWEEEDRRVRAWVGIAEAEQLLRRPALRELVRALRRRLLVAGLEEPARVRLLAAA